MDKGPHGGKNNPDKRRAAHVTGKKMILPHICFAAAYAIYFSVFAKNGIAIIYPLYIAPVVIYIFLIGSAFLLSKIEKSRFLEKLKTISSLLYVFIILCAAPVFMKLNLPEPHNFALRKLELLLGASYAVFVFLLAGYFIYRLGKSINLENEGRKSLFFKIFFFCLAFFFAVSLWFNYANQPTGDEPEYLIMAHSMVKDGDINLMNNYDNKDYSLFYNKDLQPQAKPENGKLYSYHPVLISLFFAPFYALAGRLGVTVFINMLSALFTAMIFYFLASIYKENRIPLFISLLCAFCLPLFMFSNQICSEVLSGVLILGALIIFLQKKEFFYAACVMAALIPWAHPRNGILWLALGLIAVIEYRKEILKAIIFITAQALSGLLLVWFNISHFGAILPGAYTDMEKLPGTGSAFGFNLNGILGLFMDQEFGLLFYTPIFALFMAGIILLYNKDRKIFWYSLLLFVPYFAMLSSYAGWSGGGGASPRFFVPIVFLFALFSAEALRRLKSKDGLIMVKILSGSGIIISLIIFMVPWFRWNKGLGENWILKFISQLSHINISSLFPVLWESSRINLFVVSYWVVVVLSLNVYVLLKKPQK